MTQAVCFHCGDMKWGAFSGCEKCGSEPRSDDELMLSLMLTDHNLSADQLAYFGRSIKAGQRPLIPESERVKMRPALEEAKRLIGVKRSVPTSTVAAPAKRKLDTVSAIPSWIWLIPIALVLIATARLPYDYYTFTRLVVCAFAAFVAFFNFVEDTAHRAWPVVLGLIAVLFNPVIPIHLNRATWLYLDIGTAVVLASHLVFVRLRWLAKSSER